MDQILYHYTDGAGLLGILKSKAIWCTHISYLNDSAEFQYAVNAYREVLLAIEANPGIPRHIQRFSETSRGWLDQAYALPDKQYPGDILTNSAKFFVASFSVHDDDLPQWRGYSGTGARFSIGFRSEVLQKLKQLHGFELSPVTYNVQELKQVATSRVLAEAEIACERGLKPKGKYDDPHYFHPPEYTALNDSILDQSAPFIKHPKFEREGEVRLVGVLKQPHQISMVQTEFRAGNSYLLPYKAVEIPDFKDAIASLTVGPTPNRKEALAAVNRIREAGMLGSCQAVSLSQIPYRDW